MGVKRAREKTPTAQSSGRWHDDGTIVARVAVEWWDGAGAD